MAVRRGLGMYMARGWCRVRLVHRGLIDKEMEVCVAAVRRYLSVYYVTHSWPDQVSVAPDAAWMPATLTRGEHLSSLCSGAGSGCGDHPLAVSVARHLSHLMRTPRHWYTAHYVASVPTGYKFNSWRVQDSKYYNFRRTLPVRSPAVNQITPTFIHVSSY